jgi:TolB-like protein
MSDPASKAVFLSYASQDAEAARRVCESLRAGGIEVWFDADGGLEHGDEWDLKIRRQIKECVFFIPIISANTQARLEGYFRIEWELAAQRAMGIAAGVPFVLPIAIDETRDAEALVPDRFRAVQWMRLPGGVVSPEAQARFLKLWSHRTSFLAHESGGGTRPSYQPPELPPLAPEVSRRAPAAAWIIAAIAVAFAAGGFFLLKRPVAPAPIPAQSAGAGTRPPTSEKSTPAVSDKSLVVLPLENLSPDPANAFFTDGMHSEIIATLSRIPDLKVISRTSALTLKALNLPLAETAKKVGVANVMTGSVRRAGEHVRIQLELRRAADEFLLWSRDYDRELKDALTLQSDIAGEVARALQARESKETYGGARFSTKSPQAFDLFLRARGLFRLGQTSGPGMYESKKLLEEALALDPEFVSAASLLTNLIADLSRGSVDPAAQVALAAEAKRYGELASRLAPGGAGDALLSFYYSVIELDGAKALALAENATRALPNEPLHHNIRGVALRILGRATEALAAFRHAVDLDPLELVFQRNEIGTLVVLRRTAEFEAAVAGNKDLVSNPTIANYRYGLKGELPATLDGMIPLARATWQWRSRRFAEADTILARLRELAAPNDVARFNQLCLHCDVMVRLGRNEDAANTARAALALAETLQAIPEVGLSNKAGWLARGLVRTGRLDEAIAAARRYAEAASSTTQTEPRWRRETELAEIFASARRPRECVALLDKLLLVPSGLTVPMLRVDPIWDNVRDAVGFKALLNDPKNNAPLF